MNPGEFESESKTVWIFWYKCFYVKSELPEKDWNSEFSFDFKPLQTWVADFEFLKTDTDT
jgi:hypothetical protein